MHKHDTRGIVLINSCHFKSGYVHIGERLFQRRGRESICNLMTEHHEFPASHSRTIQLLSNIISAVSAYMYFGGPMDG
jgi:hypothetical protein